LGSNIERGTGSSQRNAFVQAQIREATKRGQRGASRGKVKGWEKRREGDETGESRKTGV